MTAPTEGHILVTLDDGEILTDPQTGEPLVIPEGEAKLGFVARKAYDFAQQEKAWGAAAGQMKAMLVREQQEKRAEYETVAVSIVFRTDQEQDVGEIRAFLEGAELTADEWRELALAAKGWEPERLDMFAPLIATNTHAKPRKPYALLSPVRRLAKVGGRE